jgi:hypothetical protein
VADIASKAVSQTAKLALVLHVATDPEALDHRTSTIDAATWAKAQALGTWFMTEAIRVQRSTDENPSIEAARRVLRWLSDEPRESVTSSELMTIGPRPRPHARAAAETLDLLAELGWLRAEQQMGKRRPVYRLHPSFASFASLAGGNVR